MQRATLTDLRRAVTAAGGTVEVDESAYQLVAPSGLLWAAASIHVLRVNRYSGGATARRWQRHEYRDALDRINYGLEPCEDPDCDICHE